MKSIIGFSLNNKFAIWILTIIVTVAGLYAGLTMKQETIPDLELPIATVTAIYPGAAPEEVAENLTKPIEQRIKNLKGVDVVSSTSMENVSSIIVQYKTGTNMEKAENELREAASKISKPQGVQDIDIARISLNEFPVISLSVSSKDKSLEDITKIVNEQLKLSLEGIDGVGNVTISGQQMKEVLLTFDNAKMSSLGLSEEMVKGIIQASAIKVPLGLFEMEGSEKTIVVDGNITSLEDLNNIQIPAIPGGQGASPGAQGPQGTSQAEGTAGSGQGAAAQQPGQAEAPAGSAGIPTVKLQDIAKVEMVDKVESISRTNGEESIGISITKGPDSNTVDVVNDVKAQVEQIKETIPGVEVLVLLDQGKPIEESVSTMLNKALFGALFAIVVIMLFLRNIRTTIISIVSIPLSLLIALVVLKQMDITLNIMTLGAMTVAIGRVVDDSIVVIENNFRRMSMRSERLKGKALIIDATREMFVPILSSTLVTIAVFLPLGTVSGPIGQLFLPFALTMVFALLASLLVAITVVPMLAHMMFKKGLKTKVAHEEKPGALGVFYQRVLKWTLNHKLVTFAIAIVLLVSSLGLIKVVGVSFLPEEEQKYAMITYSPGPGALLSDVEKTSLEAEKLLLSHEGVTDLQYSVGGQNPMSPGPSKSALFYILFEHDIKDFANEKTKVVEELSKLEPKGKWGEMDFGGGGLGGSKLSLSVFGDNLDDIRPVVDQIEQLILADSSFEKVEKSLSKTYEQYTLLADQQKLSQYGLTAGQIAMALSPQRNNPVLTKVKVEGKDVEVYVNVENTEYANIEEIGNATLTSPLGVVVPIKDVVKIDTGTSANTVTRKDGRLFVDVTANITAKDIGKASSDIQTKIKELNLPPSVSVDFGGITEQINETFTQLGIAIVAAIAIVYLLLVITFGGGLTPFAILFSLPFTVIGGLLGLLIAGETISASAMMGVLMLIGIVVTNAIVLLDRVRHKEMEGLTTREALLEAGGTRLRPILMTALATVGALLPLALGFESTSGSLISKGLGVTVIGGLISSTLLTLVIVPIVYEFLSKFRKKKLAEEE
ncbi:efflux RND transporter permease subunit [Paenibacillus eucommiae]|uniref:HAE1 family hydrophobic/amphiphilic exporter-1 n=1 Tax=Paenibacillus eucommiae TaxID=1355755 RepID=A0ABS4J7V4_9BACL|nr:efflux RND transporter permease subunit [Paenibacillus eucommiae]MBP1995912.1 HAE1 family hydrophobic/amphiphilic exporter-1 [Paenibacillus eucommiae]